MSRFLPLQYGVGFGKGDASDWLEWDELLTDQEEAIYLDAVRRGLDLNEVEGLKAAVQRAYEDIEIEEISNLLDIGDEYVMECQGWNHVDPNELNRLVHKKDPSAIEFFELQALSDEALKEWDANDLDELPTVEDFYEDFEPRSPFDEGLTLTVEIVEPDEDAYDEDEV